VTDFDSTLYVLVGLPEHLYRSKLYNVAFADGRNVGTDAKVPLVGNRVKSRGDDIDDSQLFIPLVSSAIKLATFQDSSWAET
jgi:hypothetical protein